MSDFGLESYYLCRLIAGESVYPFKLTILYTVTINPMFFSANFILYYFTVDNIFFYYLFTIGNY